MNMQWSVRARSAGRRRTVAYARSHSFEVGAPVEFDEAATAVSALEYVLGALAAEMINGFTDLARRQHLEVDAVEAVVTGTLNNPLTLLHVVGEEGDPGLEGVTLKLYVSTPAPAAEAQRVWEQAQAYSPLALTLQPTVALDFEMAVTP